MPSPALAQPFGRWFRTFFLLAPLAPLCCYAQQSVVRARDGTAVPTAILLPHLSSVATGDPWVAVFTSPACSPATPLLVPDPPHCGGSGAPPQPYRWSYPCPAVASMSGIRRGTSSSQRCRACALSRRGTRSSSNPDVYSIISVTTPAPTVRPPSRIANRSSGSIAIGMINSTSI